MRLADVSTSPSEVGAPRKPTVIRTIVASDGTHVALRSDALDDDDLVLIHMGAGAVERAATSALLNFDLYRGLESDGGLFCVSAFGLTNGVTKADIFTVLRHSQYGQARYGDIKQLVRVLPTSITDAETTPDMAVLQSAHFDLVLDLPGHAPADARLIEDLDESERASLYDQVCRVLRDLLPRFEPRRSRKDLS